MTVIPGETLIDNYILVIRNPTEAIFTDTLSFLSTNVANITYY